MANHPNTTRGDSAPGIPDTAGSRPLVNALRHGFPLSVDRQAQAAATLDERAIERLLTLHDGGHAMRRVHFERCDEDAQDAANWFDTEQDTVVEPLVRRLGYSPTREEWRAEYSLTFQGFEIASRLAADCHDAHSARAER